MLPQNWKEEASRGVSKNKIRINEKISKPEPKAHFHLTAREFISRIAIRIPPLRLRKVSSTEYSGEWRNFKISNMAV